MGFFQGNTGFIAVRTNLSLLVAFYNQHMYPSVAAEAIESLGKFQST
jgi:Profilin